jgi:UDP-N-acetyl-D-glucosamine dehydrogenase
VAVIGQGYVGLPLSISMAKHDYNVIGIDVNSHKVNSLNKGISVIEDLTDQELAAVLDTKKYYASCDFSKVGDCSVIVICVPTPLTTNGKTDLSNLTEAVVSVSKYLKKESLVIIESTVAPGTVRHTVAPLIQSVTNLSIDNFLLAFSPERVDPSNKSWSIQNTPKIVSGLSEESLKAALNFYSSFIDYVVPCQSLEVAETAKLLENSFRLVNISFINEVSIFCQKMGIKVEDVIKAAATKPFGFMPFYPSIGAGGHCIPIDPIYLAEMSNELGVPIEMINLAASINKNMPGYFVDRSEELLGNLHMKKILVVGLAYKPNVADVRETPVATLISRLRAKGATVDWHDDLVKEWNGEKSVELSNLHDLAIIATPHDYLDLTKLESVPILNTRGSI